MYEDAPAAPRDADAVSGERRTYAQIAKDASYTQTRLARARAEEQKKEEIAAKVREEREKRRKEKEKKRKEYVEKKIVEKVTDSEIDSDKEEIDPSENLGSDGFSINRSRASSPFQETAEPGRSEINKKHFLSPAAPAPESKLHCSEDGPRRGPGQQ